MNRTKLKNYAPQARKDFIQAMTDRAAYYGLTSTKIEPVFERGDIAVIAGREHPKAVARKRKQLEERIKRIGSDWTKSFEQLMEAMAYTWFNRFVAIRFMELHGYFEHGYRVLSARNLTTDNTDRTDGRDNPVVTSSVSSVKSVVQIPEILLHAEHIDFPGLKKDLVIDLKLAGNKEAELYRLLLTSQCNALHKAMPFLFEKIDDETELLLPDNLLNSDSLIRKLVNEIDEEDWTEVEIIGWLYQFYISDKKDEVIGKVVASEDIPAATQLFTPNWIVKYLVQNTIGRLWLEHHPSSPLRAKMEYYIEPAEQTPEVQAQLQEIIRLRAIQNRGLTTDNTNDTDNTRGFLKSPSVSSVLAVVDVSLNPEELTLLDPACGSGHILVEAYDLFKAIYQERGYRAKDIPGLILQKNLFGLEIDDRAAQLAAFALMMKARADDRRIFESDAKPNVVAFVDSKGMDADEIAFALNSPLSSKKHGIEEPVPDGFLFETEDNVFTRAGDQARQESVLSYENDELSKADVAELLALSKNFTTFGSLIQVSTNLVELLDKVRKRLNAIATHGDLTHASTLRLVPIVNQLAMLATQYDSTIANPPYMGSKFYDPILKLFVNKTYPLAKADLCTAFIERSFSLTKRNGLLGLITMQSWMFLSSFEKFRIFMLDNHSLRSMIHLGPHAFPQIGGQVVQVTAFTASPICTKSYCGVYKRLVLGQSHEKQRDFSQAQVYHSSNSDFLNIPGGPLAYWSSKQTRILFLGPKLQEVVHSEGSVKTGDNPKFVRCHWEVAFETIHSTGRWRQHPRGGDYRKWYGNVIEVVNWSDEARAHYRSDHVARIPDQKYWNLGGICWSEITISRPSFRVLLSEEVANNKSLTIYTREGTSSHTVLAFLNSIVARTLLFYLNPTIGFGVGDVMRLPWRIDEATSNSLCITSKQMIDLAKRDWDESEVSFNFACLPQIQSGLESVSLSTKHHELELVSRFRSMRQLEESNNRICIEAYSLQDELSPEIPDEQITLYRPEREEDIKRLLSYAIGCTMGRYSLDKPGLIYAHSGNQGFDPSQYQTFRADDDGIIPVLDTDWGIADDATNRIVEFISVAWPKKGLEENLQFIAESLGPTGSEQPRETIRRYLSNGFYKHHLSMYKKRPIYWVFSSGKQRAFQCLVYLHRYNEGTLARMRTEYVIPLQGQIAARIDQLEGDKLKATSTSHGKKLQKEQGELKKKQAELASFEEKLKNTADQKISLDLDDGVKVNYAKFSDLLAESKAITGGKEDE